MHRTLTSQKMKDCNQQAKAEKGAERKEFVKTFLSEKQIPLSGRFAAQCSGGKRREAAMPCAGATAAPRGVERIRSSAGPDCVRRPSRWYSVMR